MFSIFSRGQSPILSFLKALLFYALTIANDNPAFVHSVFISPNENSTFTTLVELSHSLSTPSQVVEKCGNIIIGWLNSRRFLSAEAKQICEQRIRAVTLDIQRELPSTLESAVAPSPSFVVQYNPTPQTAEGAQYFTDENGDQHGPFPSAEIAVWESQNYNGGQCRMSYSTCITCYSAARNADANRLINENSEEARSSLRLMQGTDLSLSSAAHIAEITPAEYNYSVDKSKLMYVSYVILMMTFLLIGVIIGHAVASNEKMTANDWVEMMNGDTNFGICLVVGGLSCWYICYLHYCTTLVYISTCT
jgi:hypothetical protein